MGQYVVNLNLAPRPQNQQNQPENLVLLQQPEQHNQIQPFAVHIPQQQNQEGWLQWGWRRMTEFPGDVYNFINQNVPAPGVIVKRVLIIGPLVVMSIGGGLWYIVRGNGGKSKSQSGEMDLNNTNQTNTTNYYNQTVDIDWNKTEISKVMNQTEMEELVQNYTQEEFGSQISEEDMENILIELNQTEEITQEEIELEEYEEPESHCENFKNHTSLENACESISDLKLRSSLDQFNAAIGNVYYQLYTFGQQNNLEVDVQQSNTNTNMNYMKELAVQQQSGSTQMTKQEFQSNFQISKDIALMQLDNLEKILEIKLQTQGKTAEVLQSYQAQANQLKQMVNDLVEHYTQQKNDAVQKQWEDYSANINKDFQNKNSEKKNCIDPNDVSSLNKNVKNSFNSIPQSVKSKEEIKEAISAQIQYVYNIILKNCEASKKEWQEKVQNKTRNLPQATHTQDF